MQSASVVDRISAYDAEMALAEVARNGGSTDKDKGRERDRERDRDRDKNRIDASVDSPFRGMRDGDMKLRLSGLDLQHLISNSHNPSFGTACAGISAATAALRGGSFQGGAGATGGAGGLMGGGEGNLVSPRGDRGRAREEQNQQNQQSQQSQRATGIVRAFNED